MKEGGDSLYPVGSFSWETEHEGDLPILRFREYIGAADENYDIVLIDTPSQPRRSVTDLYMKKHLMTISHSEVKSVFAARRAANVHSDEKQNRVAGAIA
ncbi:hypothetical protein SAMN05421823_11554 [Catalinimonas alkaloidigena]|uniref:Uncharacterized protein n=1 Tax=Catalinimonas alkaloidigena TaxID=1075417 RepID=A0A1G9U180_9BACT|nr:hypothetical protein SAMN05421823_11554 [Catalinimonas alkaloidigena]